MSLKLSDVCSPGIDGQRQVPRFLAYPGKDLDDRSYLVLSTDTAGVDGCREACSDSKV